MDERAHLADAHPPREIARKVEYVELALEEDFNDRFGEAMQFPHMFDEFPHLKGILPEPKP